MPRSTKYSTICLPAAPMRNAKSSNIWPPSQSGPIDDEVREHSAQTISRVRATEEAREGFEAFIDKRAAKWIPR